jgi:hypothetical protein
MFAAAPEGLPNVLRPVAFLRMLPSLPADVTSPLRKRHLAWPSPLITTVTVW